MFKINKINSEDFSLSVLQSNIFQSNSLIHCFTTRLGGNTPKPLDTFPLSAKDYPEFSEYATENLQILCNAVNCEFNKLIMPNQQHTDNIVIIKDGCDIENLGQNPCDGIITNLKNYTVCLVFADCIPVLLFDEKKQVLALIHAGWKGTAKNIVQKAVLKMQKEFLSDVNDIKAAIGAGICQKCFEVNNDVATQLGMSNNNDYGNIFVEYNNKIHVDLKMLNKYQLEHVGIYNIDVCEYCTCCNNDIFYSYRADNKITGRHGMLAMIKE